ncbi:T9SS type A sorting domain-containing protein [Croceimicrobium hydrocarbonivorans]|uniref:T9SS type A sorting domain-containing protein n=1 Tax=Croceimicrobium hydrocarbonivorans TaxID=2761580 RepID=A0A7H0VD20_9FLAO|nr:T9SS type A sorting domain-containing protein [Croceimicrobium hydrocarbonivorans]QNR23618.1 T9SS type A sorting domain-containing protein [Croceimicrobium hydrocarbonivorans]
MKKLYMLRRLFIILLLLSAFSNLKASHILGGILDYYVVNPSQYKFVATIYYEPGYSPSNIQLAGPLGSGNMALDSSYTDTIFFDGCGFSVVVYKYSLDVNTVGVPGNSGWNFSISACCTDTFSNVSYSGQNMDFTISCTLFKEYNPISQSYVAPTVGTINTKTPSLFHYRTTGAPQKIPIAPLSKENSIDSVVHHLSQPFLTQSQRITWENGYNQFAPFPDPSEDTLNGVNFLDSRGFLNFNIQGSNTEAGRYLYGVRYNHYKGGNRIIRQFSNGALLLGTPDSSRNMPDVLTLFNDTAYQASQSTEYYSLLLEVQDTFNVELFATQSLSGELIRARLFGSHGQRDSGVFQSLNPQGAFLTADSNRVTYTQRFYPWDLVDNQSNVNLRFSFSDTTCLWPLTRTIEFNLKIRNYLKITNKVGDVLGDTLFVCPFDTIELLPSGNYNSLALWSSEKVQLFRNTNTQATFVADSSGWIFLNETNGNRKDSIYINLIREDFKLMNSGLFWPRPNVPISSNQEAWFYNDILPIYSDRDNDNAIWKMGAGYYTFIDFKLPPSCPEFYRDTLFIYQSWESLNPLQTIADTVHIADHRKIEFRVLSDIMVDSLYIIGLDTNATPNFSIDQQEIEFILSDRSQEIRRDTIRSTGKTKICAALNSFLSTSKKYSLTIKPLNNSAKFVGFDFAPNFPGDTSGSFFIELRKDISDDGLEYLTSSFYAIGFKVGPRINIDEHKISKGFNVHPNPTDNQISLYNHGLENEVRLLDISGKLLWIGVAKEGPNQFDLTFLKSGIYTLLLNGSTQKIVKLD